VNRAFISNSFAISARMILEGHVVMSAISEIKNQIWRICQVIWMMMLSQKRKMGMGQSSICSLLRPYILNKEDGRLNNYQRCMLGILFPLKLTKNSLIKQLLHS
jgi:hypothetical protein